MSEFHVGIPTSIGTDRRQSAAKSQHMLGARGVVAVKSSLPSNCPFWGLRADNWTRIESLVNSKHIDKTRGNWNSTRSTRDK